MLRRPMIDWDDLRHFLAVHRHGNLARAGAVLHINPTTVGRRLAALEERIGSRLFERHTSGWTITEAGLQLLPRAERIETEVLAVEREVAGADARLEGTVRVSATEMLATRFIVPYLWRFREMYPDLTIEMICTGDLLDLERREADIALALTRSSRESLIVRRIARSRLGLYASAKYLEKRGLPERPDETLAGHYVLLLADTRAFDFENEWMQRRLDGARVALRSDSVTALYAATLGGLGIALLPRAVADREPLLHHIETTDAPEPRPIWQMVHRDLQHAPRVRAVLDFLAQLFAPNERRKASSG